MAFEIERKFLVLGQEWRCVTPVRYVQGYLNRDKDRTVRIRIAAEEGFLTVKGRTRSITRLEYEYPIALADAEGLLKLCEGPLVEKYRYRLSAPDGVWEIDEFLGDNLGLVIAEIELTSEDQLFQRPAWLGAEVTHDARYFNSNLAAHPYSSWATRPEGI